MTYARAMGSDNRDWYREWWASALALPLAFAIALSIRVSTDMAYSFLVIDSVIPWRG